MSQAFYTAIGGMAAGQTKVNVVADNIANMNTVGFKASTVNFSDVYYRTTSSGQAPTGKMGGVNPKQIGIGVQTAAITRDFSAGTTLTTGKATDLCIQGSSFFTVASPTVEILYTRAGNFTVDANGNLVLPNGYKALGTDRALNTTSSTTPIKIPTYINTVTSTATADQMKDKKLSELNGANISAGAFTITTTAEDGKTTKNHVINITEDMTVDGLIQEINKIDGITAKADNGGFSFEIDDAKLSRLDFKNGNLDDTTQASSNIITELNISSSDGNPPTYSSETVAFHQTIGAGAAGVDTSENYTDVTITESGIIEVKYGNNDTLSVMQDPNNPERVIFKYTLNDGTIITGNDVTINDNLVEEANLQMQMASFVNPNGLTGVGNNAYSSGPNCGMALYGSISSDAFGTVKSGILEGSNVDLATQFADMVVSQRAIEANSRVFDATNQILQTLSTLGR